METLILTENDIKPLADINEAIEIIEIAFKEKALGRTQMPPKPYIFFKKYNGDIRVMPSYLERLDTTAVKIVNSHPDNPIKYHLPTVIGILILIDPKTGFPISIMDGTYITNIRTGAAGGMAAKHLAKKDVKIVGMIGTGIQARTQLMALSAIYKKFTLKIFDISKVNRDAFADEVLESYSNITDLIPVDSAKEAVEEADIITTTTPSREPIVKEGWAKEDAHFNCIGADAPGKQELDPMILKHAKILVDDMEQAIHGGEINVPFSKGQINKSNIYGEIGEVLIGKKEGRVPSDGITIFCATGLAIQDAITAKLFFDKAIKKEIGRRMQFIRD